MRSVGERHLVEDEELKLGADEDSVGDAGALEIVGGPLRDAARVFLVKLASHRIGHIADERQRLACVERVDHRCGRVGEQQHVGSVNGLEAPDGGAVKPQTFVEDILVQLAHGHAEVVLQARNIGKSVVDELNAFRLCHCDNFGWCAHLGILSQ